MRAPSAHRRIGQGAHSMPVRGGDREHSTPAGHRICMRSPHRILFGRITPRGHRCRLRPNSDSMFKCRSSEAPPAAFTSFPADSDLAMHLNFLFPSNPKRRVTLNASMVTP
jgi:hypothetical protein